MIGVFKHIIENEFSWSKGLSFVAIALFIRYLISIWLDNNMEFWLTKFTSETTEIPQLVSFIITILLGDLSLVISIISELLKGVV